MWRQAQRQRRERRKETGNDDRAPPPKAEQRYPCYGIGVSSEDHPSVPRILRAHARVKLSSHGPRYQHRDAHAEPARLPGYTLSERGHEGFAGVVGRLVRPRHITRERSDVQDSATPPDTHRRHEMTRQQRQRSDVEVDETRYPMRMLVDELSRKANSRAVHQDIDIEPKLSQFALDHMRCVRPRDIEGDVEDVRAVRALDAARGLYQG